MGGNNRGIMIRKEKICTNKGKNNVEFKKE